MKLFGGDAKRKVVAAAETDLHEELRESVVRALHSQNRESLSAIIQTHHSADVADTIEWLTPPKRRLLISLVPDLSPEVLIALADWARDDVLEHLTSQEIATAIRGLESDDALTIIEDLHVKRRHEVLNVMSPEESAFLKKSLHYPKDSAGRLMQHEVLSLPDCATVEDLNKLLASNRADIPLAFYEIFIHNPLHLPLGSIPLHRILRVASDVLLRDIMDPQPICIPADLDQEKVGHIFRQYGLVSAPVVDRSGHIVGMITADDVVTVLDKEADEDLLYLTGAGIADYRASIMETSFYRLRWLAITLVNTLLASSVIYQFQFVIEKMIALAVIMPIVAAMGGNAGMQVVTVTVRALATQQLGLHKKSIIAAVIKELRIGLANSMIFSLPLGALIAWWFHDLRLGIVLTIGMIFNIIWAGAAGTLIPLLFAKIKVDPAVAAGPLLTTTTDVLGYLVFLGLALLFLV
ncbi:MAG: magnesium transporter [Alphaproteobacteria bacterium]